MFILTRRGSIAGYTTDEREENSQKDEVETFIDILHFSLKSYQFIFLASLSKIVASETAAYDSSMLSMRSLMTPAGTRASTTSPTLLPIRACAIGDFTEIFPSARFASCGFTMV